MKLEETGIYRFIRNDESLLELHTVKRKSKIVEAAEPFEGVWYLLEGEVHVCANGTSGKCVRVDDIKEDNFVGHLSNVYGQNFYCDSVAVTQCTLLFIPEDKFKGLMASLSFSRFFYQKTSNRLYDMYKKDLAKHLFSQQQQVAYYLLLNRRGNICNPKSLYRVCEVLRISRRNLYNILEKLEEQDLIARDADGTIRITDPEQLTEIQRPLECFLCNRQS